MWLSLLQPLCRPHATGNKTPSTPILRICLRFRDHTGGKPIARAKALGLKVTHNGLRPGGDLAPQRSPDLLLANPLCCQPEPRQRMRFGQMKRRNFIMLLGSAVAWPIAARAQQAERVRRVGLLMNTGADLDQQNNVAVFVGGLQQLGWTDGRNVQIDIRWGLGDAKRIRSNATEVLALAPEVIVATGNASMGPLLQATHSVPIVFTSVADPVGAGYVDSLARPGGNVTGFLQFEYPLSGKWLELLKQIAPGVTRAAVLRDPAITAGVGQFAIIQSVAPSVGIEVSAINMRDADEIARAITAFARVPNGGLILTGSALAVVHRELIITLAARHKLPAVYYRRYYADSGGLISYGYDVVQQMRDAAGYVDRILRGEKPADLPVQAPTKYELVINLKTARALGLEVPASLLALADKVIE
jgi:putative tryptophan/tyrosine transport system substrate-binding protein